MPWVGWLNGLSDKICNYPTVWTPFPFFSSFSSVCVEIGWLWWYASGTHIWDTNCANQEVTKVTTFPCLLVCLFSFHFVSVELSWFGLVLIPTQTRNEHTTRKIVLNERETRTGHTYRTPPWASCWFPLRFQVNAWLLYNFSMSEKHTLDFWLLWDDFERRSWAQRYCL